YTTLFRSCQSRKGCEAWGTWRSLSQAAGKPQAGARSGLGPALVDVLDGLMHGRDLLGVLVRDLDLELLFERHHQLDRIQRVRTQVIDERGVVRDLLLFDAQLLGNDGLYLLFNRAH